VGRDAVILFERPSLVSLSAHTIAAELFVRSVSKPVSLDAQRRIIKPHTGSSLQRVHPAMAQHSEASGPPPANGAPTQPPSKSETATPKLNNEVELGDMPSDPAQNDIMQMARVGDIAGMEKLFESPEYDATYTDDEGITPLHVCTRDSP